MTYRMARNKISGKYGYYKVMGGAHFALEEFTDRESCLFAFRKFKENYIRERKNAYRRERNQVLRDIYGTSARKARLDSGIGC